MDQLDRSPSSNDSHASLGLMSGKPPCVEGGIGLDESLLIEAGFQADPEDGKTDGDTTVKVPSHENNAAENANESEQLIFSYLPNEADGSHLSGGSVVSGEAVGSEITLETSGNPDAGLCPPPDGFKDSSPQSSPAKVMIHSAQGDDFVEPTSVNTALDVIHLESKDELCHLSDPVVQDTAGQGKENDEDRLNPEEEEAALKFLQLQEQKKKEDDFDDDFDVGDFPSNSASATSPNKVASIPSPVGGKSTFYTSGTVSGQLQSKSTFYDKVTVEEKAVTSQEKTQVHSNGGQGDKSVFYTETNTSVVIERKEIVGESPSYTPAAGQNVGANGDARPMTAGKEITQLNSDAKRPPLVHVNGSVVDPNERSQDYSLNATTNVTSQALLAAKAEWDTVQTITPALDVEDSDDDSVEGITAANVKTTPSITYEEAFDYLNNTDMSRYKPLIRPSVHRGAWGSFKHMMFGPPKLQKNLLSEREKVFLIAACAFDNREEQHFQILQTIYKKLTGSKFDCQRYGDHWELVGFQGTDPSTDLRAAGLLGLLNVLYLVTNEKTSPLARDIYKLSLHEVQNFPFCVTSINMTSIALQCLRDDSLNKECNKRQTVMSVFNDIYAGCFLHLYQIWKSQHKTIRDSGYVIKDVETFVKKNPKGVLKNLETYLTDRGSGKTAILEDGNVLHFAGVCDMGAKIKVKKDDGDLV